MRSKYLKYESLPRPVITAVKLDVQLFPKARKLVANGRYDLKNETNAPIRDVHVRQGDQDAIFTRLELSGARLVSDDKSSVIASTVSTSRWRPEQAR